MAKGIDYGLGLTNIDTKTGIRYGVISQHSLASWFYDEWEAEYGDPTCPKCGETIGSSDGAPDCPELEEDWFTGKDYVCFTCKACYWSDSVFGDDPIGHKLKNDEYHAVDCLYSDVMILRSPYYTYAPFCSPCVPGAGNLDDSDPDTNEETGVKTFCFSHDLFEDRRAPYRVFRVEDGTEVLPDLTLYDGESGIAIVRVPPEAIDDCSHQGQCDDDVKHWITRVEWLSTRADLARMLKGYGAWEDLDSADLDTLKARALWVLACNAREERRSNDNQ